MRISRMAKRLFVGGLPYEMTDADLKALFAQAGEVVSANVIIDKFTGRSKGFGFVEMAKDEEAQKAISELSDKQIGERKIIVQEARPLEERAPRRDFGGGRSYDRRDDRRSGGDNRGYSRTKRW